MAKDEQTQKPRIEENSEKLSTELLALREELAKKDAVIADYTDHLKRLQAEFENYCKRVSKEREEFANTASEKLVVKLLLVVDDFERALPTLRDASEQVRCGVELIFKNLHKLLDDERVKQIDATGHMFDPYQHEVLLSTQSDQPEGIVLEELQKGYTMNGRVIRYSKVKVSKHNQ